MVVKPQYPLEKNTMVCVCVCRCVTVDLLFTCLSPSGKVWVPKQKPMETRQEDVTTLDPELEEALSSATDTELCDLAGRTEGAEQSTLTVVAVALPRQQ